MVRFSYWEVRIKLEEALRFVSHRSLDRRRKYWYNLLNHNNRSAGRSPSLYRILRLICLVHKACLWSLFWATSISVSSSHPCLCPRNESFHLGFQIKFCVRFSTNILHSPPISSFFVFDHIDTISYYSYLLDVWNIASNNSVEYSPWEAISRPSGKYIHNILRNSEFHFRAHISTHWSISGANLIQSTLESYFFMIRLSIIMPFVPKASSYLFPSGFPTKTLYACWIFLIFQYVAPIFIDFIIQQ
jgi:hypothetical protein